MVRFSFLVCASVETWLFVMLSVSFAVQFSHIVCLLSLLLFIFSFSLFHHFQSQAIKRTTDEKVDYVYNIFMRELKMVNKELNQRIRPSSGHMPQLAGEAHWVRALKNRIQRPMEVSPQTLYDVQCLYN